MTPNPCTEERFLTDIRHHEMNIIKDKATYRHIKFSKPNSNTYWFDLLTWPGYLCISGDCGTYVFSRTHDMFEFFRAPTSERLHINPCYWGEKLQSIGTNAGYKEFDEDEFKERVTEHFNDWKESEEPNPERAGDVWENITWQVLSRTDEGEHSAYQAVQDFSHWGFQFEGFFDEGSTERHTFSYIWCLYAIAWGIKQYDATKEE